MQKIFDLENEFISKLKRCKRLHFFNTWFKWRYVYVLLLALCKYGKVWDELDLHTQCTPYGRIGIRSNIADPYRLHKRSPARVVLISSAVHEWAHLFLKYIHIDGANSFYKSGFNMPWLQSEVCLGFSKNSRTLLNQRFIYFPSSCNSSICCCWVILQLILSTSFTSI